LAQNLSAVAFLENIKQKPECISGINFSGPAPQRRAPGKNARATQPRAPARR
jgi:hypothetical protein